MSQTLLRMQMRYPLGLVMALPTTLPPFIQNESETLMKSIFFASALSLCAAPLWAQDQVTLLLDWFVNPDHGPVIIAQERGYFSLNKTLWLK